MKFLHVSLLMAMVIGTAALDLQHSLLSMLESARPLSLAYCKGLGYKGSMSLLKQTNQSNIIEGWIFKALSALERTSCSKLTKNFACALLAPPTMNKFGRLLPCRSLCREVETSCEDALSVAARFSVFNDNNCKATTSGKGYRGTIRKTRGGLTCQSWDAHEPNAHRHITSKTHPWEDLSSNYCRNPNNEPNGPWCYTKSKEVRWDYCDIPSCNVNLRCHLMPVPGKNTGCINFQEDPKSGGYKLVVEGTPKKRRDWLNPFF